MSTHPSPPGQTDEGARRPPAQAALLALGGLLLVGGLVCVVLGFAWFASGMDDLTASGMDGAGSDLALFAGGGIAMVVGLGVIAFTRVAAMRHRGGYSRITLEQRY